MPLVVPAASLRLYYMLPPHASPTLWSKCRFPCSTHKYRHLANTVCGLIFLIYGDKWKMIRLNHWIAVFTIWLPIPSSGILSGWSDANLSCGWPISMSGRVTPSGSSLEIGESMEICNQRISGRAAKKWFLASTHAQNMSQLNLHYILIWKFKQPLNTIQCHQPTN